MEIRPCRPADAEAVAAFFASAHRVDPAIRFVPVAAWRAFLAYPTNHRGRDFRLAVADERVVGLLTSTPLAGTRPPGSDSHREPDKSPGPRRRRHFRVIVHPRWRGRGIGSALLAEVERLPLAGPRPTLQTLVPGTWTLAASFLEARGFREVCRDVEMERPRVAIAAPAPPAGVTLRPFGRPGDAAAWIRLHAEGYRREFHFEAWTPARLRAELRMPGAIALVAEERGRLAGAVLANGRGSASGSIQSLLVPERRQRRGIGRALLRAALAALRRDGRRRISLGVEKGNDGARALYVSEGFRDAREDVTLWRDARRG